MKQIACAAAAAAMLALGAGSANAAQILIPGTSQAVFTGTAHDVMTVLVPGHASDHPEQSACDRSRRNHLC